MEFAPLSEHIGSEVSDVDLREPLRDADVSRLRAVLATRHLLLFRDQELDGPQQVDAGALFGQPVDEGGDGNRFVFVSNRRDDGVLGEGKNLLFHSDNVFTDAPLNVVSLFGLTIDGGRAPTRFANAARAYRSLSTALRTRLEGQRALHLSGFAGGSYRYRDREVEPHHPRAVHPVLRGNPLSGEPVLFVCEQQTDRIIDWDADDSESTLHELFGLLYAADKVWEHDWRTGDLLVWDNLALQHGRPTITGTGERTLRRVAMVLSDPTTQQAWTKVSLAAEGKR